jgi:hypothetical protein
MDGPVGRKHPNPAGYEDSSNACSASRAGDFLEGLTRVITRTPLAEREFLLIEARKAEFVVMQRCAEFHRDALVLTPLTTPCEPIRVAPTSRPRR